jgi:kanamycin kinase
VKWSPASSGVDLADEAARLAWASAFTVVPHVLELASDAEGQWLITTALPGENAVTDRWRQDPATASAVIGRGLRELHDRLPVDSCSFSWSADERVERVEVEDAEGRLDPSDWSDAFPGVSKPDALAEIHDRPAIDRLVVCHGDACAPNTLITPDGAFAGHVDLGRLGVADRWADLAIATWSTTWNYGPGWEGAVLDAYGIDPDPELTRYYRLLWRLCP